ncbi:RNA helicase, partial [Streptomyces fagopyri]
YDNRGGGFNRDDRGGRSFERRDDNRGGHRGSDRPFNRDRQGDRPTGGGFRSGGHDRPQGRRDDHRTTGTGTGSFRRDEKPRWKRNG